MHRSVVSSVLTLWISTLQSPCHLTQWYRKFCTIELLPVAPLPTPTRTILLSVFINLTVLGPTCKWNHTIYVPLWLAYFMQHVFKVHPWAAGVRIPSFLSLTSWLVFYCMSSPSIRPSMNIWDAFTFWLLWIFITFFGEKEQICAPTS